MLPLITAQELRDLLHYDPETGVWRWLKSPRYGWVGKQAGTVSADRIRRMKILGKSYLSSRLAFLYMTGEWPPFEIDHKDLNPSNDSWDNLRAATDSQNQANRNCRKDSRIGVKGISTSYEGKRVGQRYIARIQHNGKRILLGYFPSIEQAKAAYDDAARQMHREFART